MKKTPYKPYRKPTKLLRNYSDRKHKMVIKAKGSTKYKHASGVHITNINRLRKIHSSKYWLYIMK